MAFTLGQLIDDTLDQLRGTTRDTVYTLGASIDAPAAGTIETVTFDQQPDAAIPGALLSIGQETMYVTAVGGSTNTVTVIRGYDDTTPATAAAHAQVLIDPPWTRKVVANRIRDEIRSWGPQVYATGAVDVPIVMFQRGYDIGNLLPAEIWRVLYVTAPQPPYVGTPAYALVPGSADAEKSNPSFPFTYDDNAQTSEFPSGRALFLTGTSMPTPPFSLHVVFAKPFDVDTSWTEATDMLSAVGLDETWLDIPPLGAAARLLRFTDVRRLQMNVAGQNRDDANVQPQAIMQAAAGFEQARDLRLYRDAQIQLKARFPDRSSNF
jgi:hypothetical protein